MSKRFFPAALALGLALAFLPCPAPASGPGSPSLEPLNLTLHKRELLDYIHSGEYAKAVANVALQANKYLVRRLRHPAPAGKKLAIVFDIDETTLSNLSQILANDFGYVPEVWNKWVAVGQATAIIPVQTVYDTAVRAKIDVFFITGRREVDRAATERNLREVGYDTWTKIYFMPTDNPALNTAGFKTDVRRKLTAEGYLIVANLGDQNSDVVNGYAERYFLLPNPFYKVY